MPLTKKDLQAIDALLEKHLSPIMTEVKEIKNMLKTGKYAYPPIYVTREDVLGITKSFPPSKSL